MITEILELTKPDTGEVFYPKTHVDAVVGLAEQSFFEVVLVNGNPTVKLKSEYSGLWAEGFVASGGVGSGGGGGGGGASYLDDLNDVHVPSPSVGDVLRYTSGGWANESLSLVNGAGYSSLTVGNVSADFYTVDQVNALIASVNVFEYVVVPTLPTASASTMGKLYLVPSDNPLTPNVKETYVTVRSGTSPNYTYSWEQIGGTDMDLSGYVQTSRTVNGHALTSDVTVTKGDIGLGNVENTKLSTWAGSANITTLGTISSGSIPLSLITGADDLKAIEALTGTAGLLKKTAANTWELDTTEYLVSDDLYDYALKTGESTYNFLVNSLKFYNGTLSGGTLNSSPRPKWVYSDNISSISPTTVTKYLAYTSDIPTTLKNPQKVRFFDGTNYADYDGSNQLVVSASTIGALTSHQSVSLESGTNNGTLKLTTAAGVADNIAVKGLGSLAYKSSLVAADIPDISGTYVMLAGRQTITGEKTISSMLTLKSYITFRDANDNLTGYYQASSGYTAIYVGSSDILYFGSSVLEGRGTTKNLGSSSTRWGKLWAGDADLTGDLSLAPSSHIDIGPVRIEYDQTNQAVHITTNQTGSSAPTIGLYADGFIASGGIGTSGSGSAPHLNDLEDVYAPSPSANDLLRWNGSLWVAVPQSEISPSIGFNDLTSHPTTLADYGITDAKIQNGTITLGSNTLTPLTSFIETDPVFSASAAAGITGADITAWNAKSNFSGNYDDLTNKPPIPTKVSDLLNDLGFIASESDPVYSAWAGTSRTKNHVFAAPSSSAGAPSFRALVASDLPDLSDTYVTLNGAQTISGAKTLTQPLTMQSWLTFQNGSGTVIGYYQAVNGTTTHLYVGTNEIYHFGNDAFIGLQTTKNLGSSSTRWGKLWAGNADLTGDLSLAPSSHIDIGPVRIEYDANNKALRITKNDSTDTETYGLYADGWVASGGIQQTS